MLYTPNAPSKRSAWKDRQPPYLSSLEVGAKQGVASRAKLLGPTPELLENYML